MTDLYLCPICKWPFLAEDKGLVSRRNGNCEQCTKVELLKTFGLSADFLDRFPGAWS